MKRLTRPFLITLALVALLALALQPLLRGHMPWQGDGLLHFYRLAVLERAVAAGDWYPRWSPDLGYGYGFPLFNYYAPLSYYAALPLRWVGFSLKAAINTSYALALFGLALGAYLWGCDLWGRWGGVVAAGLLVYAPYTLYNLHHRSALAELWGLAWLTLTLWAVRRLFDGEKQGGRIAIFLIAVLAYAALLLSHNVTALIGTPFLLGYALLQIPYRTPRAPRLSRPAAGRAPDTAAPAVRAPLLLPLAFFPLALALAAFFWLPAFVEKEYVQIEQLYASSNFAYANNFLTPEELGARPQTADPGRVNPDLPRKISGWQVLMAAAGWVWFLLRGNGRESWFRWRRRLVEAGALTAVTMICLAMTLPVSAPVWRLVPLLKFVQFPWRFLGLASVSLALLAGGAVSLIVRAPWVRRNKIAFGLTLALLFGVPLATALYYLFPSPPPELPPAVRRAQIVDFEVETGWLGTTAAGDYLPRTVAELPEPEPADFSETVDVSLPEAQTVTFDQFYFPGWQAQMDGEPLALRASEPHGLIQAEVPAGEHRIGLDFGNTPLRTAANWLSAVTVAGLLLFALAAARAKMTLPAEKSAARGAPSAPRLLLAAAALIAAVALVKTVYLDHAATPFRRAAFDGQQLTGVERPVQVNFGNKLILLGYDVPDGRVPSDEEVDINLYWRSPGSAREYSVGVHLLDENGLRYGQHDNQHPAGVPVPRWLPDQYARDDHPLELKVGTPPGVYTPQLFVYDTRTGQRLEILNAAGLPIDTVYTLADVRVAPPRTFPTPEEIAPEVEVWTQTEVAANIYLLGYNLPLKRAAVGQTLPLTLFWHLPQAPQEGFDFEFRFVKDAGHRFRRPGGVVTAGGRGRDGRLFRQAYALAIPSLDADGRPLEPGTYTLYLNIVHLAEVEIAVPERRFTLPEGVPQNINADIPALATLRSYQLSLSDERVLSLDLYWQATQATETAYTAFVQLLDADGRLVAQSDQTPTQAGRPRPTTSWVPGEYVGDRHSLQLPPELPAGPYRLIAGFYNPDTGKRLLTGTADHIAISTLVEVQPDQ